MQPHFIHVDRVRSRLISRGQTNALRAFEFARGFHTGQRKNGSHEFSHQLRMSDRIADLDNLSDEESLQAICFLHDVREDYGVEDYALRSLFGDWVADSVWCLTKEFLGIKRSVEKTFHAIAKNPAASVIKGVDRIDNLDTMDGAFDQEKQVEYVAETHDLIVPMIRLANTLHHHHRPAYSKISHIIFDQTKPFKKCYGAHPYDA
jgi:(p)ppGpp synthase/HD superfamily hydrolase